MSDTVNKCKSVICKDFDHIFYILYFLNVGIILEFSKYWNQFSPKYNLT